MLRNFLAGTFVITLVSSAWATNLNMNVKATANNTNAVTVAPNAPVDFYIEGTLGDDLNEGLALVGFNLHFTGGGSLRIRWTFPRVRSRAATPCRPS